MRNAALLAIMLSVVATKRGMCERKNAIPYRRPSTPRPSSRQSRDGWCGLGDDCSRPDGAIIPSVVVACFGAMPGMEGVIVSIPRAPDGDRPRDEA